MLSCFVKILFILPRYHFNVFFQKIYFTFSILCYTKAL